MDGHADHKANYEWAQWLTVSLWVWAWVSQCECELVTWVWQCRTWYILLSTLTGSCPISPRAIRPYEALSGVRTRNFSFSSWLLWSIWPHKWGSSSNGPWILSTQSYVSLCFLFFREEFPDCYSGARNSDSPTEAQKRIVGRFNRDRSRGCPNSLGQIVCILSIPIFTSESYSLLLNVEWLMRSRHSSY